ncbi:MAG: response regulator [Negativicutes bacterium]|nr:response regulator [Negativicutes bacterium]
MSVAKEELTVLVVDDQPGIRRLLSEVLKDNGFLVATAANGYEGIKKAEEINPGAILIDMKMPGMDGIEALRELKRLGQSHKAIVMTAYGELDLVNEAKEIGAYAYVTKPFDIMALCSLVNEIVLGGHRQEQLLIG